MHQKTLLRSIGPIIAAALLMGACAPATSAPTQPPVPGTPVIQQVVVTATSAPQSTSAPASKDHPIEMHIGVSFDATELQTWLPLFQQLGQNHPEWLLAMDETPFASNNEKMSSNVAAGTLPCVSEVAGALFNPYVQQGAFIPLDSYIANAKMDMTDFWPHVMEEWQWQGKTYGIPAVAAPTILFFNKQMFDTAKMAYPTDNWTMDDFEKAAIQLTLDKNGKNPTDPAFDPNNIQQWGFNDSPGANGIWAHNFVEPWGGTFCADTDCTRVVMTTTQDLQALNFWYDLTTTHHASLYDPYSGAQTGTAEDPFNSQKTAMGMNGFFAVGEIRATTNFAFGVRQMPMGPVGRSSALSTRGYAIAANCKYPDEAFKLIQELTSQKFLNDMWAASGLSVPARRTSAQAILTTQPPLDGAPSVLATMEYAHGFRPNGPGAIDATNAVYQTGLDVFSGKTSVEAGYAQMAATANDILAKAGSK